MVTAGDALVGGCGLPEQQKPRGILLRLVPLRRALQFSLSLSLSLGLDADPSVHLERSRAAIRS